MGWLIALGAVAAVMLGIVLIGCLPVGVRAVYEDGKLKTWYTVFSFPVWNFDLTKQDDQKGISLNKILTSSAKTKKQPPPESLKKSSKITDELGRFWDDVKLLLRFYWGILDLVVLKRLDIRLILGGEDPYDQAIHYGQACGAVSGVVALIENFVTVSKRNISVDCDFTAEQTLFTARLDFSVPLAKVVAYLFKFVFTNANDINTN